MKKQSFKIGDLVQFNVIIDASDSAENKFGVEPQNSWHDVEVYVEKMYGEIVSENTVQVIYKDGKRGDKTFQISDGKIEGQWSAFLKAKNRHNLKTAQILDESGISTFDDFLKVSKVPFIALSPTYIKMSCLKHPPKISAPVTIVINSYVKPPHVYENGEWRHHKTNALNTDIDETAYWQVRLEQVYMNSMVFVEQGDFFGNQSPA